MNVRFQRLYTWRFYINMLLRALDKHHNCESTVIVSLQEPQSFLIYVKSKAVSHGAKLEDIFISLCTTESDLCIKIFDIDTSQWLKRSYRDPIDVSLSVSFYTENTHLYTLRTTLRFQGKKDAFYLMTYPSTFQPPVTELSNYVIGNPVYLTKSQWALNMKESLYTFAVALTKSYGKNFDVFIIVASKILGEPLDMMSRLFPFWSLQEVTAPWRPLKRARKKK